MPTIVYSQDEYEALEAKNQRLKRHVEALESMRPQWAEGHSSDSVAAQVANAALGQIYTRLKVNSQTAAMNVLDILINNRQVELRRA